jgi:A/G-specific adenine glycosylase
MPARKRVQRGLVSAGRAPRLEPASAPARDRFAAEQVEAWFASNCRELPWRTRRTGYTALVSEAMLQQTQVSRVVDKYVEFMRRFPTVADLARAAEREVLAAWQGLGYYGRAKRLHAAAKAVVERFGGRVPSTVDELRTLPGVGPYTAGAIASIAFGRPEPIVDTNVARVLMRLDSRPGTAGERATAEWVWSRAGSLVAVARSPAAFNEGLMELGATICPAGEPACSACPLANACLARARRIAATIPEPALKAARKRVYHHAVVFERNGKVLLVQRPSEGLWSSMWQVPTVEADEAIGPSHVASMVEPRPHTIELRERFVHQTSHREVVFVVHRGKTRVRDVDGVWVAAEEVNSYALSNPMRAIVAGRARNTKRGER